MSGVVFGILLEASLPRASADPVLSDLYFLFRHLVITKRKDGNIMEQGCDETDKGNCNAWGISGADT